MYYWGRCMDSGANPDASTIKKQSMGANKLRHACAEPLIFTRKASAYIPQLLNGKLFAKVKAAFTNTVDNAIKAVAAKAYGLVAVAA